MTNISNGPTPDELAEWFNQAGHEVLALAADLLAHGSCVKGYPSELITRIGQWDWSKLVILSGVSARAALDAGYDPLDLLTFAKDFGQKMALVLVGHHMYILRGEVEPCKDFVAKMEGLCPEHRMVLATPLVAVAQIIGVKPADLKAWWGKYVPFTADEFR